MEKAAYSYFVDWNGLGTYNHALSDISAYVLTASWQFGNDSPVPGETRAGAARLLLDNSSGMFSPGNPTLGALVRPGLRVKIRMTVGVTTVQEWGGFLETLDPITGPTLNTSTAELVAYGILAQFTNAKIDLAMQTNITTVDAAKAVLTAAGIAAGDKLMTDTGQSTLSRFWAHDKDVLSLLRELEAAECGLLRETKDSKIDLEDRAHRSGASAVSTYGTGVLRLWNLRQRNSLPGIFNLAESRIRTFNVSEDVVLATIADVANNLGGTPPVIPGSGGSPAGPGALTIWIEIPGPSSPSEYLAVADWGIVDYEVNTAADGSGTDITTDVTPTRTEYGNRLKLEFENSNASAGYFVVLRAHGSAVVEGDPLPVKAEDATSQTKYRKRAFPNPSQWLTDQTEGQNYCDHIVACYKNPRTLLSFELRANYDSAHLAEAQRLDISDLIHVTATTDFGLYIDEDLFVEYLAHSVDQHKLHKVQVVCAAALGHELAASGTVYTPNVIREKGLPDDLWTNSIANGLNLIFGGGAWKYNVDINLGEFRARYIPPGESWPDSVDLRTVDEGGTLAHNGATEYVVTGLTADWSGCQYDLISAAQGRWYFAFRLHNASGWSVWSDGNRTPEKVTSYCDTREGSTDGPPADWTVSVKAAPTGHGVIVTATRPQTNGDVIWGVTYQVKDASTGSWRTIDANAGAASTLYDGSAIDHTISLNNTRLTRNAGTGFGTAAIGDLILMDVRGGAFDHRYCQWGTVKALGANYVDVQGRWRPAIGESSPPMSPPSEADNLRIKIVKPPWQWTSEGYLGAEPNSGMFAQWFVTPPNQGDTTSAAFESGPIDIPISVDLSNVQARVWFDNGYSRSDDMEYSSSGATGGSGRCVILADAATIATNAALAGQYDQNLFIVSVTTDRVLGNPTGAVCGQKLLWRIINASAGEVTISLDTKFRNGLAFPLQADDSSPGAYGLKIVEDDISPSGLILLLGANTQAYLQVIRDSAEDKFDILSFRYDYGNTPSFPAAWGYWKMEETSGDRADATGNGHTFANTSSSGKDPGYDAGVLGNALKIQDFGTDGTYGYHQLTCSDFPNLSGNAPFTLAFWFKVEAANITNGYVLDWNSQIEIWTDYDSGDAALYISAVTPSRYLDNYTTPISLDAWHQLILVYDGSTLNLYLDNTLWGSDSGDSGLTSGTNHIDIWEEGGAYPAGHTSYMDEAGLWTVALTADERSRLWNGGAGWSPY